MTATARIREFIESTFFVEGFADDESFLASGILDSMGVLELVTFVESSFGVVIDDSELVPENLDSIANLSAFLDRKLASSPAG